MPGVQRMTIDRLAAGRGALPRAGHPGHRPVPGRFGGLQVRRCARGLESRRAGAARGGRAQEAFSGTGRDHRRGPRPVHFARPGRTDRRYGLRGQRRNRGRAGQAGPVTRRGRRRRRRTVRHDGRPHRRDSPGVRNRGLSQQADPGVLRQVRFQLLRTVPRRRRFRRATWAAATSTPTRWIRPTPTKRCAKSNWTSKRAPTW